AVFHDHDLFVVALHVRQGFREDVGDVVGRDGHAAAFYRAARGRGRAAGAASRATLRDEPRDGGPQFRDAEAGPGGGRERLRKSRGTAGERGLRGGESRIELGGLDRVRLGEYELIADREPVEARQQVLVDRLEAVAGIDQNV